MPKFSIGNRKYGRDKVKNKDEIGEILLSFK